ncbi:MAG: hypothetical protein FJW40_24280 [Acidobacteria bacterium]|nr:hypothetical protein [Acidobacteriota bacterium]
MFFSKKSVPSSAFAARDNSTRKGIARIVAYDHDMTWLRRWLAPLLLPVLALAQVDLGDVLPGAASVRVAVIGDFGYSGSNGGFDKVAAAVKAAHASTPFDLGLTVGDNFYPSGVRTGDDTQWTRFWKPTYGALGIRFYPSLGNHDYQGDAAYQVTYSAKDPSWRMPARYYTFAAGPARFYALDTDEGKKRFFPKPWSDTQRDWLAAQFKAHAGVKWKIV